MQIISCPHCEQKLGLPDTTQIVNVTCPTCRSSWIWPPIAETKAISGRRSIHPGISVLIIATIFLLAIFVYYASSTPRVLGTLPNNTTLASAEWPRKAAEPIEISYRDLLDLKQIINTGETIEAAIAGLVEHPENRAGLQPFLAPQSRLLIDVIDALNKPCEHPLLDLADRFPVGGRQPAWASLCRSGSIVVAADEQGSARVFLQGKDPQLEYKRQYSVIRHALAGLKPKNGPLNLEVFTYENDYSTCCLRLNSVPAKISVPSFPTPEGRASLDLQALSKLFEQEGQLCGGRAIPREGLTLLSERGPRMDIMGEPVALSDLAVAYRAIFHAGDNEAFISLDPNLDPTRVTVNFGGLLEDTRIGACVLQADKRFKTITSGLDPDTHEDLRLRIRKSISDFLTGSERDLSYKEASHGKWIGTRFWYYPDSVEVEADSTYQYALVKKARFTADAERRRDDFDDPQTFEKLKKATLSPSIKRNIENLNFNYDRFSDLFPELRDMGSVARLMGICSWLRKAKADEFIDLDALLAVELPPMKTERERTQLLAVCFQELPELPSQKKEAKVVYLTPVLDEPLRSHFSNPNDVTKLLSIETEAARLLFAENKEIPLRNLISSKEDLESIASYFAERDVDDVNKRGKSINAKIDVNQARISQEERRLEGLRQDIEASSNSSKAKIDEYNKKAEGYNALLQETKKLIAQYNLLVGQEQSYIIEIGGGINLEPEQFNIRKTPANVELQKLKDAIPQLDTTWSNSKPNEKWIRTRAADDRLQDTPILARDWTVLPVVRDDKRLLYESSAADGQKYWHCKDEDSGSWRDQSSGPDKVVRQRSFDAANRSLTVVEHKDGKLDRSIIVNIEASGKIKLSKSPRTDLISPAEPPIWWMDQPVPVKSLTTTTPSKRMHPKK